jgi:primosomal protein N'
MRIRVALASGLNRPLTYEFHGAAEAVRPGTRVVVPLGRTFSGGWVLDDDPGYLGPARPLIGVVDGEPPAPSFFAYIRSLADRFLLSPGLLLDMALPPIRKPVKNLKVELPGEKERRLGDIPVAELGQLSRDAPLRLRYPGKGFGGFPPFPPPASHRSEADVSVVIGGDRTPPYRDVLEAARGGSVLLVVPDHQSACFWQLRFPELTLYTSALPSSQRNRAWTEISHGGRGVCGNLAALLLPIPDLRALIIDRAASPLYRWGRGAISAPLAARLLARHAGVPLLLGSAGHSVSTFVMPGEKTTDRRPPGAPPVEVHPVRGGDRNVPGSLLDLLVEAVSGGGRTLVMTNRINAASAPWCPKCRRNERCPHCGRFLTIGDDGVVSCPGCFHRPGGPAVCSRCGGEIVALQPMSLTALEAAVHRRLGESGVRLLSAEEIVDPEKTVDDIRSSRLVLATPCVLNPFFRGLFERVICVRPEALFDMDEYNAAEMIQATLDELRELLSPGGRLDVYSVYHFHYALQLANSEDRFFDREQKYREWFHLPPFAEVYRVNVRGRTLRALAERMRRLRSSLPAGLRIRRAHLLGRVPARGWLRGMVELHGSPAALRESGWLNEYDLTVEMIT